jgi:hypothetical protein
VRIYYLININTPKRYLIFTLQLHSEFSLHLRQWLAERSVVRVEDCNFSDGGVYKYYSKSGDSDVQPPSDFKVRHIGAWTIFTTPYSCRYISVDNNTKEVFAVVCCFVFNDNND